MGKISNGRRQHAFSSEDYMHLENTLHMESAELIGRVLDTLPTKDMLAAIERRGGAPGAVAEAALLAVRKAEDYGSLIRGEDPHKGNRDKYFPLGLASYAQMIYTKALRLVELSRQGGVPNFESARDTCLDAINYSSFAADWLKRRDEL